MDEQILKSQLTSLLNGSEVHASLETILGQVNPLNYGIGLESLPYTLWQLLEHLRISQKEILDYMKGLKTPPRKWPSEYWPKDLGPRKKEDWTKSLKNFHKDHEAILKTLQKIALFDQVPHQNEGHIFLREFLLLASHQSYHLGQFVALRRLLNDWHK